MTSPQQSAEPQTGVKTLAGFSYAHSGWDIAGGSRLWEALLEAQSELGEGVAVVEIVSQRFLFVNEALCRMFGYTAEEMLALPSFFTIMPPDEVAVLEPERERQLVGIERDADRYETRVTRRDGATIYVEAS